MPDIPITPEPPTVLLRVSASPPVDGATRHALEVEVEGHGRHLLLVPPTEADQPTAFLVTPGGLSQGTVFRFAHGRAVVPIVGPMVQVRDQFEGDITLPVARELLRVLHAIYWSVTGDAAIEALWNAGDSIESADFFPMAEAGEPSVAEPTPPGAPGVEVTATDEPTTPEGGLQG